MDKGPQVAANLASPDDAYLAQDAVEMHKALTELIRVYQFRDRDLICCHDLSVSGYYALDVLVERGPLTLNELAAALYLDKSSASRVVAGLDRKGYVERRTHPQDGRALLLGPTGSGRGIHERIVSDTQAEQRELLRDFDPEVRQAMSRLVARLARAAVDRARSGAAPCCPASCEAE